MERDRRAELEQRVAVAVGCSRESKDAYLVALARHEHVDAIVSGHGDLPDASTPDVNAWTPRQLPDQLHDR